MGVASRLSGVGAASNGDVSDAFWKLYSNLDACELGVRDETTRMLVRKEWTFMTNSENLPKILNLRCSDHQARLAERNRADIYPVKLYRRAAQQILKIERWNLVQHVLQPATLTQAFDRGSREFEGTG